jgi:Glutaminase
MRVLALLLIVIINHSIAHAHDTFVARLHSIGQSSSPLEAHVIKFENGRVGLSQNLKYLKDSQAGDLFKVQVDKNQKIISLLKMVDEEEVILSNPPFVTDIDYYPTLLEGKKETLKIFNELRTANYNSQSFNRAHIWAYEQYQIRGLQSMKAFLFLSDELIRQQTSKWWFQVAPYVTSIENGKIKEKVMDPVLAQRPVSIKQWTQLILSKDQTCHEINSYVDFLKNNSQKSCFVMKTTMYFWHPIELQNKEEFGIEKVTFFEWEIQKAYLSSFGLSYP